MTYLCPSFNDWFTTYYLTAHIFRNFYWILWDFKNLVYYILRKSLHTIRASRMQYFTLTNLNLTFKKSYRLKTRRTKQCCKLYRYCFYFLRCLPNYYSTLINFLNSSYKNKDEHENVYALIKEFGELIVYSSFHTIRRHISSYHPSDIVLTIVEDKPSWYICTKYRQNLFLKSLNLTEFISNCLGNDWRSFSEMFLVETACYQPHKTMLFIYLKKRSKMWAHGII